MSWLKEKIEHHKARMLYEFNKETDEIWEKYRNRMKELIDMNKANMGPDPKVQVLNSRMHPEYVYPHFTEYVSGDYYFLGSEDEKRRVYELLTYIRFERDGIYYLMRHYTHRTVPIDMSIPSVEMITQMHISVYLNLFAFMDNPNVVDPQTLQPVIWKDENQEMECERIKRELTPLNI